MATCASSSRTSSTVWATNTTLSSTGWSRSRAHSSKFAVRREPNRTSRMLRRRAPAASRRPVWAALELQLRIKCRWYRVSLRARLWRWGAKSPAWTHRNSSSDYSGVLLSEEARSSALGPGLHFACPSVEKREGGHFLWALTLFLSEVNTHLSGFEQTNQTL